MEAKSRFFAYGPTRDIRVLRALTGSQTLLGHEAVLKGYKLGLQRLDQVPSVRTVAPKSPQEILKETWPAGFEFHVVLPEEKGEGVAGTVVELTPQEAELFKDFELIDLNWYKDGKGKVVTSDGQELEVNVPVLREGQEISREIDGINYDPWFNCKPEDFIRVAEKARREFFERMGQTPEGKPRSEIESRS